LTTGAALLLSFTICSDTFNLKTGKTCFILELQHEKRQKELMSGSTKFF
jgi:hypothetical protein